MDGCNNLPSFRVASGGPAGSSCRDDTAESRLYYQGMSVQTLNSSRSACFSQSNGDQNNVYPINPLSEFRVAPLTQVAPNSFDASDLTFIPESTLDEYLPRNPDEESIDDELFPILSSYLWNQSLFSGNEPDIREPTPANRLNPDHHLTDLTAELASPRVSRPFAVVNPLNLEQGTNDNPANSAEIVDDKSSQVERRRKRYRNYPAHVERERERLRERRKNPAYRERERESQRERRKNPAYAERERESQRERRKNPAYRERERERYRNDPVYAKRRRELYRNNPAYAERRRMRYQNDPVYAEGHRIYNKIYYKMKKKISKEEASKLALVAREEYLQSVNYPKDSGDLPQTSNSAETTQNSNKNASSVKS